MNIYSKHGGAIRVRYILEEPQIRCFKPYSNKGIKVISGASGKVKDVLNEWKVGMSQIADENLCKNCSKDYWEVVK